MSEWGRAQGEGHRWTKEACQKTYCKNRSLLEAQTLQAGVDFQVQRTERYTGLPCPLICISAVPPPLKGRRQFRGNSSGGGHIFDIKRGGSFGIRYDGI